MIRKNSNIKEAILKKAAGADLLERRIAGNAGGQEINFNDWVFKGLKIKKGMKILELCCGTGAQTLLFLKAIGEKGKIVGIDISREALDILAAKIGQKQRKNALLLKSGIDSLSKTLLNSGIKPNSFDLIFCSYGLYYSSNAQETLEQARRFLASSGEIIIVGPFGKNNNQLFGLLESAGVKIPPYVMHTSRDFMYDVVIPWATDNFKSVCTNTIVNRVRWTSADQILGYWKNTTFYFPEKLRVFKDAVNDHFGSNKDFINEKWVMKVRMFDEKR